MDRKMVESSVIRSIGYDAALMTLEVEFHRGAVYQYFKVPNDAYFALMGSGCIECHLNRRIKGKYEAKCVGSSGQPQRI